MTNNFQDHLAYVTHIRAEHKRLRERLNLIEKQWALCNRPSHVAESVIQILGSVRSLRAELAHHFEEEESGGCLEEAVSRQASLSHEMAQLEREHPELLGQIDRLIEGLRADRDSRESARKIEQEFRRFATQLRAHEAAENRILEQGFGVNLE